jgi:hypothetical protein
VPITFQPVSAFSDEHLKRNEDHSASLGLPLVEQIQAAGPLAIVGGGPSINQYRYTLQSWRGPVWAVNGAWKWCRDNSIDATFFSYDANPSIAEMADGVERAILGKRVDPSVYQRLTGKAVWIGTGDTSGTTSVGEAIVNGLVTQHPKVTLFGCESCFQPDQSHAYGHHRPQDELVIWCNGMHFWTSPQMLMAAVEISSFVRSAPELLIERSGGLLRAMVDTPEYEIVGYSEGLEARLVAAE